jgi:hypothetical protein
VTDVESEELADFREKSSSAGRMGKAAEYLVAAVCILATRGELNVSTSLVDDEGVDLVFNRRGSSATLAVQVKARMSDSKLVADGTVMGFVRSQTFRPRPDLDLLFIAVDIAEGRIMSAWLIPSTLFDEQAGKPTRLGRRRFSASLKPDARDKWASFRLTPSELARRILERLTELDN